MHYSKKAMFYIPISNIHLIIKTTRRTSLQPEKRVSLLWTCLSEPHNDYPTPCNPKFS